MYYYFNLKKNNKKKNKRKHSALLFGKFSTGPNWSCRRQRQAAAAAADFPILVVGNNFWLLRCGRMKGLHVVWPGWAGRGGAGRWAELGLRWAGLSQRRNVCLRRLDEGSVVELGDGALAARVRALVVDALAVALHLGQVLVEDLARAQRRHQVVELAAVLLAVGLGLARLALPLPLLFQLAARRRREEMTASTTTSLTKAPPPSLRHCVFTDWEQTGSTVPSDAVLSFS